MIAFLAAWALAHLMLRGKEVPFRQYFVASLVLIALGFALTFPPIFEVIAGK